jgi:hypothetical protein
MKTLEVGQPLKDPQLGFLASKIPKTDIWDHLGLVEFWDQRLI